MPARPLDHAPSPSRVSTNDGPQRRQDAVAGRRVRELDARAVGRLERRRPRADRCRVAAQQAQRARGSRRAAGSSRMRRPWPATTATAGRRRGRRRATRKPSRPREERERRRRAPRTAGRPRPPRSRPRAWIMLRARSSGRGRAQGAGRRGDEPRLHPLRAGGEGPELPPRGGGPRRGLRRGLPGPDARPRPLPEGRRAATGSAFAARARARRSARSASRSWSATAWSPRSTPRPRRRSSSSSRP